MMYYSLILEKHHVSDQPDSKVNVGLPWTTVDCSVVVNVDADPET